jgi:hypothetical protein
LKNAEAAMMEWPALRLPKVELVVGRQGKHVRLQMAGRLDFVRRCPQSGHVLSSID